MKNNLFSKTNVLTLGTALSLSLITASQAQTIGKLEMSEFTSINKEAQSTIAAIKPTDAPLSSADQKLMTQVAMGGMMQLQISEVAVKMATSPEVKAIAEAEVAEQAGLATKLKEISAAKKMSLPSEPDAKTQKMVEKLQGMSGAEFDRAYLKESGVAGHEMLNKTMQTVSSTATDPALKAIATASLPLIKTHLQVAQDQLSAMKK
jgi:putative membrane protein